MAFPLGGVGTGQVSIGSDGALRQWQLVNQINHRADVPETGFALRVSGIEPPLNRRVLLRTPPTVVPNPAPLVADHLAPAWPRLPDGWGAVDDISFSASYPFAELSYAIADLPLSVRLEAHTPFVPRDLAASSLPVVSFRFRLTNTSTQRLHGFLVGSFSNTVGWDGVTPIEGTHCASLGGNANTVVRSGSTTTVAMTNPSLDLADPLAGSLAAWTDAPAAVLPCATSMQSVLRWADSLKLLGCTIEDRWSDEDLRRSLEASVSTVRAPSGPSPAGQTWLAGVAVAFAVAAEESIEIEVGLGWHFANRVVNFDQFGPQARSDDPPAWIGNAYATPFRSATDVVTTWSAGREELRRRSRAWADALDSSALPELVIETLHAQQALVRSPTVFVGEDGTAYGFEGGLGASTTNWNGDVGGSCPLTCTHVWNYAQTLAALFPSLERTMRDVEWQRTLSPEGYLPHRVRLPLNGPQLHDVAIGGPLDPALDGMLGAVLKTYRELRAIGDVEWLARCWEPMTRLMDYVHRHWDDGNGVLRGRQPVTFDIDLTGPNMYVGSLWIAALAAMGRMAELLGRAGDGWLDRSRSAAEIYDRLLWNGEYYGQADQARDYDFGAGCLTDQLIGQWWAHQLDLGHVLPADHVRSALDAIVGYNLKNKLGSISHGYRVFADADDSGVVVCSWPHGGRPVVPIRYADEVWSGSEYALAALLIYEGMADHGLSVLGSIRARQDGSRRNPFNEIECGDHYARAMSGWSLLGAATGVHFDAVSRRLKVGPIAGPVPFLAGNAWGVLRPGPNGIQVEVMDGEFELEELVHQTTAL